ncbi:hypothetical protein HPB48_005613 [Haemaphysalis longicornis]|uniref:Transmembrane protein n=1 Tax=Haemaphysalis longicornis TaxID=44386 RepID=A0A9J6GFV5_HAELO|nr:hypothetical protein HPB48_005613 [Haemaphysalis longicornis]
MRGERPSPYRGVCNERAKRGGRGEAADRRAGFLISFTPDDESFFPRRRPGKLVRWRAVADHFPNGLLGTFFLPPPPDPYAFSVSFSFSLLILFITTLSGTVAASTFPFYLEAVLPRSAERSVFDFTTARSSNCYLVFIFCSVSFRYLVGSFVTFCQRWYLPLVFFISRIPRARSVEDATMTRNELSHAKMGHRRMMGEAEESEGLNYCPALVASVCLRGGLPSASECSIRP